MEKTRPAALRSLEDGYAAACNAYVAELARLWGITLNAGCYWIGDEPGGVYDFDSAWTIGMEDIRYAVKNAVTTDKAYAWREYVRWAGENGFQQPSLREYIEARIPLVGHDAQERITQARQELMRLCEEERYKMARAFLDQQNTEQHVKE